MLAASGAKTFALLCLLIAPSVSSADAAAPAELPRGADAACQHAGSEEEEETSILMQKQKHSGVQMKMEAPMPEATISKDGRTATVRFQHMGRQLHYDLEVFSVYEDDAELLEYDDEGEKRVDPGSVRTFRSRVDSKWASARLHEDGTVSGLFVHEGSVLELSPDAAELSLINAPGRRAVSHSVHYPDVQRIFAKRTVTLASSPAGEQIQSNGSSNLTKPFRHLVSIDECTEENPWCRPAGSPTKQARGTWPGERWFPGCYQGDRRRHRMVLDLFADVRAQRKMRQLNSTARIAIEAAVAEASMVFEQQMNIRLRIGSLEVYRSDRFAPDFANSASCQGGSRTFMSNKLTALTNTNRRKSAVSHLFTGCGDGYGVVGLAYVGTACTQLYNTGVNSIITPGAWLTFAHELGHNIDADHSFEEGQGQTGGIMDYGDGLLDGVYQFNTQYRRDQVCQYLDSIVGLCGNKFDRGR